MFPPKNSLTITLTFLKSKWQTMLRKYISASLCTFAYLKKIIRLIRLFKVFCFKPCIGHVTCKRKREVLLHRCKQDSCLFKSSRRNKKSIGLCLRKWTGLTVTNRHVTRIAWYSCGTTTEKRPLEICRMVILLLDWLETKITFSVNFDKNLPTHLLLQISDRVA